ncbi:MAG: hypothetical protein WCK23_06245, partial [Actinomycetes bacterium]
MWIFDLKIDVTLIRRFVFVLFFALIAAVSTFSAITVRADGITWTTQTSPADNDWRSIAWGGPTGQQKFVAVA